MTREACHHAEAVPAASATSLRVLVCGGREYKDRARVFAELDALHAERGITLVIEGGARGADTFARQWAQARGVEFVEFRAEWNTFGKMAGAIRNQTMLDDGAPDLVVAFPGGRGTADMIRRANAAQIPVMRV